MIKFLFTYCVPIESVSHLVLISQLYLLTVFYTPQLQMCLLEGPDIGFRTYNG